MLRVIAGKYRRRRLESLEGQDTRPMLDRLRETLFNVIAGRIAGKIFVDLYAGTGAVGIEALSHGAASVIFVEQNPRAAKVIEHNLTTLDAASDARIVGSAVADALPGIEGDVYFLGPPYALHEEYEKTLTTLGASPPELVIVQHASSHELAARYGGLEPVRVIQQGKNSLSFFEPPTKP